MCVARCAGPPRGAASSPGIRTGLGSLRLREPSALQDKTRAFTVKIFPNTDPDPTRHTRPLTLISPPRRAGRARPFYNHNSHAHLQNTESSFSICEFSPDRAIINILRIAYVALMCIIALSPFFLFLGTCTFSYAAFFCAIGRHARRRSRIRDRSEREEK